jgi:hypothetical protein
MLKPVPTIGKQNSGIVAAITSFMGMGTLTGILLGYSFSEHIDRGVDFFLYHNVPVAETSYQDPRAIDIKIMTNEKGERQTYVVTTGDKPKKVPICHDLLPTEEHLIPALKERYYHKMKLEKMYTNINIEENENEK